MSLPKIQLPYHWAAIQGSLELAYAERIEDNKVENIETALIRCEEALSAFTQEAFLEEWTHTQTNLGSAYMKRVKGRHRENIDMEIGC